MKNCKYEEMSKHNLEINYIIEKCYRSNCFSILHIMMMFNMQN